MKSKLLNDHRAGKEIIIFSLMIFNICLSHSVFSQSNSILYYHQPAEKWEEALPLGNGKIGLMVYGGTTSEHIQLNDDSMWPADLGWDEPGGNKLDLEEIRRALFAGDHVKADELFVEKFSRKKVIRSHQTLGDLFIDFEHQNITEYRRELNISNAIAKVSYKTNNHLIHEELFVSYPHQAILIQINTDAVEGINAKIRLTRPQDHGYPTSSTQVNADQWLIMQGEVTQRGAMFDSKPSPILQGVKFETCLKIKNIGGEVISAQDYLELKNVKQATFYMVSNSSYYFEDYSQQNIRDLTAIIDKDFESLKKEHIEDYKNLYDRVDFKIGNPSKDPIPTDQRLEEMKKGSVDLGLEALLFHYGRYLLISSSRPGSNPANLQGLWNEHIEAPWNADYHLNINLQMNYWLANVTQLGELNDPLFDYVDKLVENGKTTARVNFGCAGTFLPHATDLWAPTWLRAPTAYWGCSAGAGGWLMQHYWQHFEFTKDTTFLKHRVYPALQEVAAFYSDWLIEDPRDGMLISAPSTSPENRFYDKNGQAVATCLGSAMDQQVIAEVFDHYIRACDILDRDSDLLMKVQEQRPQLRSGFIIGSVGRILEWDREYTETEPGHRHMSHLYGFHPGNDITKEKDEELFSAVKKTLDYRLENGGAGTGWSRAWLINCSARLRDGNMAYEHIQLLFKNSMYNNLFDGHPPFQIDGNFGYTAGVAEMLVQSTEDEIRLLPALPDAWAHGSVKGLCAKGGFIIDMEWESLQLKSVTIQSQHKSQTKLIIADRSLELKMEKGEIKKILDL